MPDFSLNEMSALLKGRLGTAGYSRQIAAALALAHRGHEGQFREQADSKAQPIPYIVHPVGVALLAAELFPQMNLVDEFDDVIAACLTHDLLEDTVISPYDLERATSRRTLELVTALSKPSFAHHSSREERNEAFLNAIKEAGKTAIFIKICDSLHNLSRPELTPMRLLAKTARKGRSQYVDLIETGNLGEALLAQYRTRLDEVDALVSRARDDSFARAGYDDIETVFTYCRERAKRKVLEVHDAVEILKEITGAQEVLYTSIRDFIAGIGLAPSDPMDREISAALRTSAKGSEITVSALPDTVRARIAPATRIVSVTPKAHSAGKQFFLVLLGPTAPRWVSESALTVVVAYLLERALFREASRVTEIADLLRTSRLDFDPQLAIEAGFAGADIVSLAHSLEAASAVKAVLDVILLGRLPPNIEARIERRESRTKASGSTVRKMISKKTAIGAIEDLVGYRFVVRNLTDKEKITRYLTERIQDSGLTADLPPIVKAIKTSRGYVADHILCAVRVGNTFDGTVQVEVQVRTILEDAWARVSQTIDYKKNNVVAKRNERILKRLRDMIDEVENEL
jgi:Region found in RelA / SpoT proteins